MKHYKKGPFPVVEDISSRFDDFKQKCLDAGERLFNWIQNKTDPYLDKIGNTYDRFMYKFIESLTQLMIKLVSKSLDLLDLMIQWRNKHERKDNTL